MKMRRAIYPLIALTAISGAARAQTKNGTPTARVMSGADVLASSGFTPLAGKRVGLITNHTGVVITTAGVRSTIDVLHESSAVHLIALFSPEHGIRGTAQAGVKVSDSRDDATGLPVHSLYGPVDRPTPEMLQDIDVLVYDIQDVGARYYTYVWTMMKAMQAAAQNHVKFVVLDRPDVVGGALVQGNVLDTAYSTLVGLYPAPMRFGMTVGEIARYVNAEYHIGADLTVIPMRGWKRTMWYDDTGLLWTPPSPNIPSIESAAHYSGSCLFEGTNLSIGRGTPNAFQQFGAPWLDAPALATRLRAYHFPGVRFDTVSFTPDHPGDGRYPGAAVRGIRLTTTNRTTYDPTRVAVAAVLEIHALHADSMKFVANHFDRLSGTDRIRKMILAGSTLALITSDWSRQTAAFDVVRKKYLLYR